MWLVEEAVKKILGGVRHDQLKMSDLLGLVGAIEGEMRAVAERIKWW